MTSPRTQVHLGAGAFARANTWLATSRSPQAEVDDWGIVAVAQRSGAVIESLRDNGWAYTVVERDENETRAEVIDVVTGGLVAQRDPAALKDALTDAATSVITITATEAAYPRTPGGSLDRVAVAEDLADGGMRSLVGQIVTTARERARSGTGALNILVCDNILNGGEVLRGLAIEFAQARGEEAASEWLAAAAFPNTVVDRIVPAPTEGLRQEVAADTGVSDPGMVATEPFFRWVLQDAFVAPRPQWEHAGALLVDDVRPWQAVKLNLVNAPHSFLAYLGLLSGHSTVHSAVHDPVLRIGLEGAFADDLIPAIPRAPGITPEAEAESTLRRFANPFIEHRLDQIAAGGGEKLAQRLLGPVAFAGERGADGEWLALILAAWAECAARGLVTAPTLRGTRSGADRARAIVAAAGLESGATPAFVTAVSRRTDAIERVGARAAVLHLSESRHP